MCVATATPVDDYGVEDLGTVDRKPSTTTLSLKTTAKGWKAVAA
jgi:hypothetical protein